MTDYSENKQESLHDFARLLPDTEYRKDEDDGYHGEDHAGDGADGEVEPEDFLGARRCFRKARETLYTQVRRGWRR